MVLTVLLMFGGVTDVGGVIDVVDDATRRLQQRRE